MGPALAGLELSIEKEKGNEVELGLVASSDHHRSSLSYTPVTTKAFAKCTQPIGKRTLSRALQQGNATYSIYP
jgi:hypothetical protein